MQWEGGLVDGRKRREWNSEGLRREAREPQGERRSWREKKESRFF